MSRSTNYLCALLLVGALVATSRGQSTLSDPYEILRRSLDAQGGLDRLKSERTQYFEADLAVAGLEGTVKSWVSKPDRLRVEADLGILKLTQGDNGEYAWIVDSNGKLQKTTNPDEATTKRREISRRMAEFEYADPQSDFFTVAFQGVEDVEGSECYVIRIDNNISTDYVLEFIDVESLLPRKRSSFEDFDSNDLYYDDYRDVGGMLVAFKLRQVHHQTGQVEESAIAKYESNPMIDPTLFEPPEVTAKDFRFISGSSAEDIPIRYVGNHLYIPVIVDCRERWWAIDTGAGMSVINEPFAEELGLEFHGQTTGKGAGGLLEASFAVLPSFRLPGIEFEEQTAAVIDMSSLNRVLDLEIAGILGFDFLSRFVTRIDYAAETISLYDPEIFEYQGDGQEIGIHVKEGQFAVEATLDGIHAGTWLFDIGAGTTHIDGAYAVREGYASLRGVEGRGHGAGNEYRSKHVRCEEMAFAGFHIDDPVIGFHYGGTDTSFTADKIGVLGNSLFQSFVIYCDYGNERLIIERGANFNQPDSENRSGLQLGRDGSGGYEVVFASPGTPADRAGFREGDVLRSVNGIDSGLFDGLHSIRKVLQDEPGTKLTFEIEREGQPRILKLKLADLL